MRGTAVTFRHGPSPAVRSESNAAVHPTLHRRPLLHPRLRLRRSPEPSQPSILRRPMPHLTAAAAASASGGSSFTELTSAADFAAIASAGGRISVIGFGSLLSERSARSTFPELEGFRVAAPRGFRRVFAHAAPIFFERGIAIEATKASSLPVHLSVNVIHLCVRMVRLVAFHISFVLVLYFHFTSILSTCLGEHDVGFSQVVPFQTPFHHCNIELFGG
uniref:Uncharacterized protein n=1 Tax=Avena sativa TaxID=4498 RepID=A0ACD5U3F6_AVESA